MFDLIHEAEEKLLAINHLLNNAADAGEEFITRLSDMTQEAYVAINDGMSENSAFCHECAHYRDYLKNLLPLLENIRYDIPSDESYLTYLGHYRESIREILDRIAASR